jgi:nicotinamidase-related amidase
MVWLLFCGHGASFAMTRKGLFMNTALLIIDIQNDYFPGGAMALEGSVEAGAEAGKLLDAFRRKGLPVIHVQHISTRAGASFFVPGTSGVEIHSSVAPLAGETIIQKNFPNSFRETPLLQHLRDHAITRLVIAGMMTQMCIDTTVRAAADLGFACSLAHDACATRALSFGGVTVPAASVQAAFLAALNGLFARVQTADELCAEL